MQTEDEHLQQIYQILKQDITTLKQRLSDLSEEGRSVKQQLSSEGHLDLSTMTDTLDTFANIETSNRQIDALNIRYDVAESRLKHAQLLLPQAYFAELDLQYGDDEPEAFYLGKVGYTDNQNTDLIYDWRAPIAEVYYGNRIGTTSYRVNDRDIQVDVQKRRQFVIDHDHLRSMIESDTAVTDQLLLKTLAEDRIGKLQEITATIQTEQNAIIRESKHDVVLVDGVAGSGKTSVLLQRIAFQRYQHRGDWSPDTMLFITPSKTFNQYIKGVLPSLGEREPLSVTYPTFIQQVGRQFGWNHVDQAQNHLKQLATQISKVQELHTLKLPADGLKQTASTDPFADRMRGVWRWLTAMNMIPEEPKRWLDWSKVGRVLNVSELTEYDKLYLLVALTDYHQPNVNAVFIDEAQDYDADTWVFLATLFAESEFTIVGDHRQRLVGMAPQISEWFTTRTMIPLKLTTSYRATGEITKFFAQFAGDWSENIKAVQMAGQKVAMVNDKSLEVMW